MRPRREHLHRLEPVRGDLGQVVAAQPLVVKEMRRDSEAHCAEPPIVHWLEIPHPLSLILDPESRIPIPYPESRIESQIRNPIRGLDSRLGIGIHDSGYRISDKG